MSLAERVAARYLSGGLQPQPQGPVQVENLRRTKDGYAATVEGHAVAVRKSQGRTNPNQNWDVHWVVWSATERDGGKPLFLGESASMKKALENAGDFVRLLRARGNLP